MASSAVAKTSVLSKDHHDRGEDKSAMTFLRIVISLAVALAALSCTPGSPAARYLSRTWCVTGR